MMQFRMFKQFQSINVTYLWYDRVWGRSISKHGVCSVINTRRTYNDMSNLIEVIIK